MTSTSKSITLSKISPSKVSPSERNKKRKELKRKQIKYKEDHGQLQEEISKLNPEQTFSSWIELFDAIDTYYPTGGNQMIAAKKTIRKYMNITSLENIEETEETEETDITQEDSTALPKIKSRGTNTIQISEIYKEPLEVEDKRKKGNNSIYISLLKSVFLYTLMQEDGYTMTFTYNQFWTLMGLRNEYYFNEDIREALPSYDDELTKEDLNDFFNRTGSKNKNITDYLLDTLEDEQLLRKEKHIMVRENNKTARRATAKEIRKIGSTEKKIMKEWGYNTKQEVFLAGKSRTLHRKVQKILGFSYYEQFKVYIYEEEILKESIIDNIQEIKEELNRRIIDTDNKSAEKRMLKEQDRIQNGYKEYKKTFVLGEPDYETYKIDNANHLYIQDTYADKYVKMNLYFSQLLGNVYVDYLSQLQNALISKKTFDKKAPKAL